MAEDPTEDIRREMAESINANAADDRAALEKNVGRTWTTEELVRDFEVLGFLAPFVVVKRRVDGKKGSLTFQHHPRYYFTFREDQE